MSAVFISYRRDDSSGHTGRLYDHLSKELGKEHVFMDIDTIEPGMDFVDAIDKEIKGCSVLLIIIGDEWLTASDENGRRLDDPNDFIRIEVRSALRRKLRIIPVLVKGTEMPTAEDLPDDIAALSRRHAIELSDSRWDYDVQRLLTTLASSLKKADEEKVITIEDDEEITPDPSSNIKPYLIPAIGIGLVALFLMVFWRTQPDLPENTKDEIITEIDEKESQPVPQLLTKPEPIKPVEEDIQPISEPMYSEDIPKYKDDFEIEQLINKASKDIKAFRLTSPPGNNAVEKYKEILEMAPGHPVAVDGIKIVAVKYMGMAHTAIKKGQLKKANTHLGQARKLYPQMDGLEQLQEEVTHKLTRIKNNQQAERIREAQRKAEREAQMAKERDAERKVKQANLESCLKGCENTFQLCLNKHQSPSGDCQSKVKAECEDVHQECLNDPQIYILFGEFGTDAECNGRWQQCVDQKTALLCKENTSQSKAICETTFSTCKTNCR